MTSVARELGMQLWLGLWVAPESYVLEEEKGQLQYLIDQGSFDDDTILGVAVRLSRLDKRKMALLLHCLIMSIISLLVIQVGSEAIYRDDATADEMVTHKNDVHNMLQQAGITNMPVTICDTAPMYSANPQLRTAVDLTMTNTFPFWEDIPIEGAVDDLQIDIDWLLNLPESQGKDFILGETGWPSAGFIQGVGAASPQLQRQYFEQAYCRIHVENQWAYYWFTGIDNAWRQEQDPGNTIEGNWGFFYADLRLKEHFVDLEFTCSNGVTYSFAELDFSIPTGFTPAPTKLDPASCQADNGCAGLGLWGNCCPTAEGIFMGCCSNEAPSVTDIPATLPPTLAPTSKPSKAATSTLFPTETETERPVATPSPTIFPTSPPSKAATLPPTEDESEPPTASPLISTDSPSAVPTTGTPTLVPTTGLETTIPATETDSPTLVPTASESSSLPGTSNPIQSIEPVETSTPDSPQSGTTETNVATILSRVTLPPGQSGSPTSTPEGPAELSTTASITSGAPNRYLHNTGLPASLLLLLAGLATTRIL